MPQNCRCRRAAKVILTCGTSSIPSWIGARRPLHLFNPDVNILDLTVGSRSGRSHPDPTFFDWGEEAQSLINPDINIPALPVDVVFERESS